MTRYSAKSLLEVVIVLAVIAMMICLTIPAVQKLRCLSLAMMDRNNERQIVLALHAYAADHGGAMPGGDVPGLDPLANSSPLNNILPYIEQKIVLVTVREPQIKMYLSPTDPTLPFLDPHYGATSYAVNEQVFYGRPSLLSTIPDGLSNTVAVSQKYCISYFDVSSGGDSYHCQVQTTYMYWLLFPPNDPIQMLAGRRSCTFADTVFFDAIPVVTPFGTRSSPPGLTFQTAPHPDQADSRLAQASQQNGLIVCMFDGSIRLFAPSVSEGIFWSSVTPAGGEVFFE